MQELILSFGGYAVYNGFPMEYKIEILNTEFGEDYISLPN